MATSDTDSLNELYQSWLEIPAERLPPNHYALLGLEDFESDTSAIEQAAKQRGAYLHQIAAGPQRKAVQQLLGQVALARRTLLEDSAKSAYDESLRNPQTVAATDESAAAPSVTPPFQSAMQTKSATQTASAKSAASFAEQRRRKKKASTWKFHAISASVLLSIVAIVWLVNSGAGGRRAAQVGPTNPNTQKTATTNSRQNTPVQQATKPRTRVRANATASKQSASTSASGRRENRKRGAAIQRSQGSGLLADSGELSNFLAANMKGDDDKSEPAGKTKPPPKPIDITPTAEPPKANQPAKDEQAGSSGFQLPNGWSNGQKDANAFPERLKSLFELGKKDDDCFLAKEGKLNVVAAKTKPNRQRLARKVPDVSNGTLVSFRVHMTDKIKQNQTFGFTLGDRLIGIRPNKTNLVVFEHKVGEPSSAKDLKTIGFAQEFTFGVLRHGKQNRLRWIIDAPKVDHTGLVNDVKMPNKAKYSIFFNAPADMAPDSLSFSQLRNGRLKTPPAWK